MGCLASPRALYNSSTPPQKTAHQVFQDVLGIENFTKSEEAFAADALFLAYQSGDAASIQKTVQVSATLSPCQCFRIAPLSRATATHQNNPLLDVIDA